MILSKYSVKSQNISSEMAMAVSLNKSQHKPTIIPIITDNKLEIPFFLKDFQGLDLSNKEGYNKYINRMGNYSASRMAVDKADRELQEIKAEVLSIQQILLREEKKKYEENRISFSRKIYIQIITTTLSLVIGILVIFGLLYASKEYLSVNSKSFLSILFSMIAGMVIALIMFRSRFKSSKSLYNLLERLSESILRRIHERR
jgi:membrane-associated HD superfamily phosphohydrolase